MTSQWVMDEIQNVEFLDKRLEQRYRKLLDSLSQASTASIPAACNDRAEMVAAYRFFDNDKVNFENEWRSLYVCRLSRALANKPCTHLYTDAEWKSVWQVVKRASLPKSPPTALEMTQLMAQLGGYIKSEERRSPRPSIRLARPSINAHHRQLLANLRPRNEADLCVTTKATVDYRLQPDQHR